MAKQTPNLLQILDSVNVVSGLVSRIDERVKILGEQQESIGENLKCLESKIQVMELKVGKHDAIWDKIFDMIWKTVLMIVAGYILYILGLQSDLAFPPP